jgi:uncharacterized membrane-anchored protein YjiN (DUF445 family)
LAAGEPQSHFDLAKMDEAIGARMEKIFARPAVDKAMDDFVDALGAEPALQKRGESLLESLGADTKITEACTAIATTFEESSTMKDLVKNLIQRYPGKTADEIGELVGKRVEKAFDSPVLSKGIETSLESLAGKLDVNWRKAGIVADATKRFDEWFDDPVRMSRWEKRVQELNGGKPADLSQAINLYIDRAWGEERTEKLLTALLQNRNFRREVAEALAESLAVDAIASQLHSSSAYVLSDKRVQKSIDELMLSLLAQKPNENAIKNQIDRLLNAPACVKAVNRLAKAALESDQLRDILRKHIDHLAADPEIAKLCGDFVDNW